MASLVAKEGLSGQVQMIFFDPPFGIGFKSNFQTNTNNQDTATNRKGLPNDTRTITAFRDTYERGIHSYLDQMHEKLALCRELLKDSGSIFVQIGDENVHRMAIVLDEVFGAENRVSQITFATTGGGSSKTLPAAANYLLWYAKDISQLKYHQVYEKLDRKGLLETWASWARIELEDGSTRALTAEEKVNPDELIPDNWRLCYRVALVSPGHSTTGRSDPYTWNAIDYQCTTGSHWRVSLAGLDRLSELNRLDASSGQILLHWKKYEDEMPGKRINNIWHRQVRSADKRYVVQTANSVIERCLHMATDPGDLVLDPTCGSGTTAQVAEAWGRRWITCDTSPVSVAIARQRLITTVYPYYTLASSEAITGASFEVSSGATSGEDAAASGGSSSGESSRKDPTAGFVYNSVAYVSAATLAYDEVRPPTLLVDQPHKTKGIVRIASPFTVESSSPWTYTPFDEETNKALSPRHSVERSEFVELVVEALQQFPIRSGRNATKSDNQSESDIHIVDIEPWPEARLISHLVTYTVGEGGPRAHAGLFIAPEDVTVGARLLNHAALDTITHCDDAKLVIVVAFAFDATATTQEKVGKLAVARVQMHRDLQIGGLKPDKDHQAFVLVGQPDIEVQTDENGDLVVSLLGYDTYDPASGNAKAGGKNDVACWMIDTNYDGESFFARRIHFPGAQNDKIMKRLNKELGKSFTNLRWDAMLSTTSAPFETPESGQIAVKIITTAGNEMAVVKSCPKP